MEYTSKTEEFVYLSFASTVFIGFSVGIGLFNKAILAVNDFPLFLLTCQFFFLFSMAFILVFTVLRNKLQTSSFWISKISFKIYFYRLCPIGFLYGLDIIFTTIGIATGPYAFVAMIKSGIPIIVLIFTLLFGTKQQKKDISKVKIISIIIITLGEGTISFTEVDFVWICFLSSMFALFTASMKLIVIEKLFRHNNNCKHQNHNYTNEKQDKQDKQHQQHVHDKKHHKYDNKDKKKWKIKDNRSISSDVNVDNVADNGFFDNINRGDSGGDNQTHTRGTSLELKQLRRDSNMMKNFHHSFDKNDCNFEQDIINNDDDIDSNSSSEAFLGNVVEYIVTNDNVSLIPLPNDILDENVGNIININTNINRNDDQDAEFEPELQYNDTCNNSKNKKNNKNNKNNNSNSTTIRNKIQTPPLDINKIPTMLDTNIGATLTTRIEVTKHMHHNRKQNENINSNQKKNQKQREVVTLNADHDESRLFYSNPNSKSKLVSKSMSAVSTICQHAPKNFKDEKIHSILALFYFMPVSFVLALIMFLLSNERDKVSHSNLLQGVELMEILGEYFMSALMALFINWVELILIGQWTALAFCIIAGIKLIVQIAASWILFSHSLTPQSLIGYILVVVGVIMYNWSKIPGKSADKNLNDHEMNNNVQVDNIVSVAIDGDSDSDRMVKEKETEKQNDKDKEIDNQLKRIENKKTKIQSKIENKTEIIKYKLQSMSKKRRQYNKVATSEFEQTPSIDG